MNIENEFKTWCECKTKRYLNDRHTGGIFEDFIKEFTMNHYSDISLIINNVERQKDGKPVRKIYQGI